MNKELKLIIEQIEEMVNNPINNNYRKHAFEELKKVEEKGLVVPHIAFIIDNYPAFNSIEISTTDKKNFCFKFYINNESIKGNKKAIKNIAKFVNKWNKRKGKE